LQEKWACLGNPSGKPSRPTHPEAEKLGFSTILSKYNKISLKNTGIKIQLVAKIEDVASMLFG
jgi:hypothetical protein